MWHTLLDVYEVLLILLTPHVNVLLKYIHSSGEHVAKTLPDEANFDYKVTEKQKTRSQLNYSCYLSHLFAVTSCLQNMWNGTLTGMADHHSLW